MAQIDIDSIDWTKGDGLVPAIIQDAASGQVLMLGFMDRAALEATLSSQGNLFQPIQKLFVGQNIGELADFISAEMDGRQ